MTSLYMLAFDHRSSFSRDLLGIQGTPTPADAARVADIKAVVYEGFELAVSDGVPRRSAGLPSCRRVRRNPRRRLQPTLPPRMKQPESRRRSRPPFPPPRIARMKQSRDGLTEAIARSMSPNVD